MEKWRKTGSILNQNKGNSGPKWSARTNENITSVHAKIQESSQSTLDYFLWGYVKENVFKRQPADIEILKEIVQEVV